MAEAYEPPRKGASVRDKRGGRSLEQAPDDAVREAFNESRRNSEDDFMLDVRFSNGSRCALAYGTLLKVDYNPADQLKLAFAVVTVVIEGRRLLPLYELLRRHRTKFIQEGTVAEEGLKPEDATHIDNIHFVTTKEDP